MSRRAKTIIGAVGIVLVVLLAPIAWSAFGTNARLSAYFDKGRCTCGHNIYIHLRGDGYYTYSPGHGVPERRDYNLRPRGEGWELVALPSSDPSPNGFLPSPKAGEVVGRIRLEKGVLYTALGGTTNWTRHTRVYNPWRVWIARVLQQ